ncbi:helix-turn-helix domain-containing protein [Halobium salinum]|uniref:Helix-turn-helix domain-containing protein n=1 Tax=Halobium salinum TaxID=1364940 RepID=A0ABD5PDU8_9EURY|nr:helix-turn-helix domain-containing protein [Halobium salinum]
MIVADLALPTPALRRVAGAAAEGAVTLDRVYATVETSRVRVQLEVPPRPSDGDATERIETALAADPTVEEYALLSETEAERRYRVTLSPAGERASTYPDWVAVDAVLLDGRASTSGWDLRLRFPSREALARYRERCGDRDEGAEAELRGLYSSGTDDDPEFGLTDAQTAILHRALELGYFDIPRSASLAEVGDSLGVTGQAASERLRRALKTYLSNSMFSGGRGEEGRGADGTAVGSDRPTGSPADPGSDTVGDTAD